MSGREQKQGSHEAILDDRANTGLGVALRGRPGCFLAWAPPCCRTSLSNVIFFCLFGTATNIKRYKETSVLASFSQPGSMCWCWREKCFSDICNTARNTPILSNIKKMSALSVPNSNIQKRKSLRLWANNDLASVLQNLNFLAIGYLVS